MSPEGATKDWLLTDKQMQTEKLKTQAWLKPIGTYGKINSEHSGLLHRSNLPQLEVGVTLSSNKKIIFLFKYFYCWKPSLTLKLLDFFPSFAHVLLFLLKFFDRHNCISLCAHVPIKLNNSIVLATSMNSFTRANISFQLFLYVFISTECFLRKIVQL